MAEKTPRNKQQELSDDTTTDDEIPQRLHTSIEEKQYGTVPGSAQATQAALSHSRAQCNPTVPRGPEKPTTKVKKLSKKKAKDQTTQTRKPDNNQ